MQVIDDRWSEFGSLAALISHVTCALFLLEEILHEPPQHETAGGKVGWWIDKPPATKVAGGSVFSELSELPAIN